LKAIGFDCIIVKQSEASGFEWVASRIDDSLGFMFHKTTAVLDRHLFRRLSDVPTISVLVDATGRGGRLWQRWSESSNRVCVAASGSRFPLRDWNQAVVSQVDLYRTAVDHMAGRGHREVNAFSAEWEAKTTADRERFWSTIAPNSDDDLLWELLNCSRHQRAATELPSLLTSLGERIVATIMRLTPDFCWPGVLFVATSLDELTAIASDAAKWVVEVPKLPIAIAVTTQVWDQYLASTDESRAKTILREGEFRIPELDDSTIEERLVAAGAPSTAVAAIKQTVADESLIEATIHATETAAVAAQSRENSDRARSAAERFLFEFLESIPETAGRFELNGRLDFRFGSGQAEVDLLCREPPIALELDGYHHFHDPENYRRDRRKDWELQQHGFLVLRFLSDDVMEQIETIRDRILLAVHRTPVGETS
jgi:very-short-patch-repair endonuclease